MAQEEALAVVVRVDQRARFGDWEGDILEGANGTGGLATHVDRESRYLQAIKLADIKSATATHQCTKAFRKVPPKTT